MTALDDLRRIATTLPEVTEGTHFRLPAFKVRDRGFVVLQQDTHALISVDEATAAAAVAEDPDVYDVVWRNETIFVGVRVDLTAAPADRVRELVEHAWRNTAPKRLVAAHDRDR